MHRFSVRTVCLAGLIFVVSGTGLVQAQTSDSIVELDSGWEYRWDDDSTWAPIGAPTNPPGRTDKNLLWLRTDLPHVDFLDGVLFVLSIDTTATVFADGEAVYEYGNPRVEGDRGFRGWPWHLISVPPRTDSVEFLVHSDYRDIGLWGRVLYGEKTSILTQMYLRDYVRVTVGAVSFALALVLLFLFFSAPGGRAYLYLSFVLFVLVLRSFTESYVHQIILDRPLFWEYISAASNLLIPATVALFLSRFVEGRSGRLMRYAWWVLGLFCVGSIVGALVGFYPISAVYVPADIVLIVFIAVSFSAVIRCLFVGSLDMRFLAAGFVGVGVVGVISILVDYQFLPWTGIIEDLALTIFGTFLSLAIGFRATMLQRELREKSERMVHLNAELEQTVRERTRELQEEKERFEQMSITDSLTGLNNRRHMYSRLKAAVSHATRHGEPLSVVVMDLDHFKAINDTHGHLYGDSVLTIVAETIRTHLRDSDIACRFGGEEFVMILPKTGAGGAMEVAERVRRAIRDYRWEHRRVPVTVSGGVSCIETADDNKAPETMLSEADQAMYRAKMTGRDRTVCFTE